MFVLAHLTDPHLGPLPPVRRRDLVSKQMIGYVNWQRNRTHSFDLDILSALTDDIRSHNPDHVAVTGDLVNLALSDEIIAARQWLDSLGDPKDITVIPGNHDAYVSGAFDEVIERWQPFMCGDGDEEKPVAFPFVRRRSPVALVGLSSAVPTAPFMATGRIDEKQAHAFGECLHQLAGEKTYRVVLIHHAPVGGLSGWPRRLIGASLFRAQVAHYGAELILHGHNHRTSVTMISGRDGPVPVVGAAAASNTPRSYRSGGAYNLIRIEGEPGNATVTMTERGIKDTGGKVVTLSERILAEKSR